MDTSSNGARAERANEPAGAASQAGGQARASGGGLALRVKIETHVARFFVMDAQGLSREMVMKEGRMQRASGMERSVEGALEGLFWAPLELDGAALARRMEAALAGWRARVREGSAGKEAASAQELMEGGFAARVMELEISRVSEAMEGDGERDRAGALEALKAQLRACCEREPLWRELSWGDSFMDLLFKKLGEAGAEAKACLELAAEHERRELEGASAGAEPSRPAPRL